MTYKFDWKQEEKIKKAEENLRDNKDINKNPKNKVSEWANEQVSRVLRREGWRMKCIAGWKENNTVYVILEHRVTKISAQEKHESEN